MSRLEMPLDGERGEPSVEEAADRAAAASALLPGENPSSMFVDDAMHWCTVYSELLSFKQALLAQIRERIDVSSADVRAEVDVDRVLLLHQANRYRLRLSFWEERRRGLSGEGSA
ncbi:MAG: hypothetical protein ABR564_00465 [Candidatus Dormibacteria bacterium]